MKFHPTIAACVHAQSRHCFIAISENVIKVLKVGTRPKGSNGYTIKKEREKRFLVVLLVVTIDPSGVTLIRNIKKRTQMLFKKKKKKTKKIDSCKAMDGFDVLFFFLAFELN